MWGWNQRLCITSLKVQAIRIDQKLHIRSHIFSLYIVLYCSGVVLRPPNFHTFSQQNLTGDAYYQSPELCVYLSISAEGYCSLILHEHLIIKLGPRVFNFVQAVSKLLFQSIRGLFLFHIQCMDHVRRWHFMICEYNWNIARGVLINWPSPRVFFY